MSTNNTMKFIKSILMAFLYLKNKSRPWRKRRTTIEKSLLGLQNNARLIVKLNAFKLRREILNEMRSLENKRLLRYGFKAYSQNDEDGMIQEIFNRIGTVNKNFLEIGVGNGLENNTLYLLVQGWHGLWVEANSKYVKQINLKFEHAITNGDLEVKNTCIQKDNINQVIDKWQSIAGGLDLLSLDIDGNDYHVIEAIKSLNARLIILEYNSKYHPPVKWVMEHNPKHSYVFSDYYGASLKSLEILLIEKGYKLVGCNLSGVNAFFVREDLVEKYFLDDCSAENHYEPERVVLSYALEAHHPPNFGPFEAK